MVAGKPSFFPFLFDVCVHEIPNAGTPMPNTSKQKKGLDEIYFESVFSVF